MEYFAGYGFNKSHSTAYALLAYQTAYLKANYPWHFMAALLTIEAQNTDKLAMYLGECRERGVPVLPPDINESQLAFTVEPDGRALRPGGDQERRRRRDPVDARRRASELGGASTRCTRCARTSTCGWSTSACSRAWSRPARSTRSCPAAGAVAVAPRRGCSRPSTARSSTAAATSAIATRARRSCSAAATTERRTGRGRAARRAAVDRERSSSPFEKEALGLYMSGHPLERYSERAEGVRRAAASPSSTQSLTPTSGSRGDRHRGLRPLKTQEGRPHGGLHARRRRRRRRGRRVSRRPSASTAT